MRPKMRRDSHGPRSADAHAMTTDRDLGCQPWNAAAPRNSPSDP